MTLGNLAQSHKAKEMGEYMEIILVLFRGAKNSRNIAHSEILEDPLFAPCPPDPS
jgi:hypothetical protein